MEKGFCKTEETGDRHDFYDGVNGSMAAWIKKTGGKYNTAGDEAKMVQKIKRAYSDYIGELGRRKTNR